MQHKWNYGCTKGCGHLLILSQQSLSLAHCHKYGNISYLLILLFHTRAMKDFYLPYIFLNLLFKTTYTVLYFHDSSLGKKKTREQEKTGTFSLQIYLDLYYPSAKKMAVKLLYLETTRITSVLKQSGNWIPTSWTGELDVLIRSNIYRVFFNYQMVVMQSGSKCFWTKNLEIEYYRNIIKRDFNTQD